MKHPPIGLFAAVMGLIGLGLASRAAAPLFPGVFRAPAYFTELWVAMGLLVYVALVVLYARKVLFDFGSVRAEFSEPAKFGFAGAPGVATSLVAAGLAPYMPDVASALWWTALALNVALLVVGVSKLWKLGLGTRELHPGWIVVCMGCIVLPSGGLALGHGEASRWVFCVGALAGLLLVLPLFRASLPERLEPTWFILLAPPSLLYLNGFALFQEPWLEALFYVAVAVFAGVLFHARRLHRWGFGPAWWSITFPLDAFALAATRYARDHSGGPWKALAGFAVVLATLVVAGMVVRTIIGLARGDADARRNADARVQ